MIKLESRLRGRRRVAVAQESQLRLLVVPRQLRVLAFACEQSRGRIRRAGHGNESAVGVFVLRRHGEDKRAAIFAQCIFGYIGERAFALVAEIFNSRSLPYSFFFSFFLSPPVAAAS